MRINADSTPLPAAWRGGVAALGNFDGLHRGHQAVLGQAAAEARRRGRPFAVITFEPHPRRFFKPDTPPFRLTPRAERRSLLSAMGVDLLIEMPFDAALAATSADAFIERYLHEAFGLSQVVVGYDYHFGHKRAGNADLLRRRGGELGFDLAVVDAFCLGDCEPEPVSSTQIRQALCAGEARRAADLLGHWWGITGTVVGGDQRGRTIGFPTANIQLGETLEPAFGVYAARTILPDGRVVDSVTNLGRRPTFEGQAVLLETYLFDFDGDLYGQSLRVELVERLRGERKFDGLDALKAQIAADCDTARALLADPAHARARLKPPHLGGVIDESDA
ncbi:riboflavin biosynthesis protein RibF [Rhodothalassium salexigens]|uniref:bifunctional riboflavin kinase/FAD synthetase n=1 Tax=Rhodothalassium salexigens TaxID=1086 RepID=UPI0019139D88|nr:bifunctional riboflavin kinase/FAD synthetase [Rhodothalassium salexigens]MBK5910611.1 riboflavin biosynthesis protein RibF [Rhodothalassium salexigens]MBK5920085.1 riboflavin biosynthesis protein RibF [Rhodothalassium salexigens]